ncbi:methyltransferase domain-containing protein [Aliiglaciecola sp. 3_MG-2023]|uniref:methyltransferase domain-containing protein n=1 Tax=Aliiglaciecola sp. 3_MG-2023 TaxID=3062644 RepID=UPI0026E3FF5E|nr:methyltransferase domain-containing protein [Aliiglaciecola sp. 3_MG-2023]MDO6693477.1 methyltransferase domain-containing protein [Aliiglaciecola sp. 3_MG-2023]
MSKKSDQSFDSLMDKFANNIYGSSKGKLRHELLVNNLNQYINHNDKPLDIIDVGGGTGIMSKVMLEWGHKLTFNDLSADAVAMAKKNLANYENVSFMCSSLSDLPTQQTYDVVICHAVLEWLESPLEAISSLLTKVKPGGVLSLSFFNKDAHRFGNLLYGNFDYVAADMKHKNTVRLNPNNALEPQKVIHHLDDLPCEIISSAGIRCFHDYLRDITKQTDEYEKIKAAEIKYGHREPYKWLGKYFHLILRCNS